MKVKGMKFESIHPLLTCIYVVALDGACQTEHLD